MTCLEWRQVYPFCNGLLSTEVSGIYTGYMTYILLIHHIDVGNASMFIYVGNIGAEPDAKAFKVHVAKSNCSHQTLAVRIAAKYGLAPFPKQITI